MSKGKNVKVKWNKTEALISKLESNYLTQSYE